MGQAQRADNEQALFLHRELGFVLRGASPTGESQRPALAEVIAARAAAKNEAESARLLYVAMTRARDYFVLCGREKPGKGSWFEALDLWQPFLPGQHGDVLCGAGWRASLYACEDPAPRARPRADNTCQTQEAVQAALDAVVLPLTAASTPQAISVSRLLDRMGLHADEEDERDAPSLHDADAPDATPGAAHNDRALLRGSVVHRLFECWDFHAGVPPLGVALEGTMLAPGERAGLSDDLAQIAERFVKLPIFDTLKAAVQVRRELPFVLALGGVVVHGTIDALVDDDVLIDYKTGRPAPEKQTRYALQARLYAAALRAITGQAPARAVIVYVDHAEEIEVSLDPGDLDATLALARRALGLPE
jgi:ATP-dependent helicase/nuclease subunit A